MAGDTRVNLAYRALVLELEDQFAGSDGAVSFESLCSANGIYRHLRESRSRRTLVPPPSVPRSLPEASPLDIAFSELLSSAAADASGHTCQRKNLDPAFARLLSDLGIAPELELQEFGNGTIFDATIGETPGNKGNGLDGVDDDQADVERVANKVQFAAKLEEIGSGEETDTSPSDSDSSDQGCELSSLSPTARAWRLRVRSVIHENGMSQKELARALLRVAGGGTDLSLAKRLAAPVSGWLCAKRSERGDVQDAGAALCAWAAVASTVPATSFAVSDAKELLQRSGYAGMDWTSKTFRDCIGLGGPLSFLARCEAVDRKAICDGGHAHVGRPETGNVQIQLATFRGKGRRGRGRGGRARGRGYVRGKDRQAKGKAKPTTHRGPCFRTPGCTKTSGHVGRCKIRVAAKDAANTATAVTGAGGRKRSPGQRRERVFIGQERRHASGNSKSKGEGVGEEAVAEESSQGRDHDRYSNAVSSLVAISNSARKVAAKTVSSAKRGRETECRPGLAQAAVVGTGGFSLAVVPNVLVPRKRKREKSPLRSAISSSSSSTSASQSSSTSATSNSNPTSSSSSFALRSDLSATRFLTSTAASASAIALDARLRRSGWFGAAAISRSREMHRAKEEKSQQEESTAMGSNFPITPPPKSAHPASSAFEFDAEIAGASVAVSAAAAAVGGEVASAGQDGNEDSTLDELDLEIMDADAADELLFGDLGRCLDEDIM